MPQWQGSASRGAYRLRQGASVLARLFPAGQRVRVDTDGPPADSRDGVAALDTLAANLSAVRAAHANARARGRAVVTVGGDCGVDLVPIEAALAAHGDRLTVVWFDAHGDLNTPASSPSGAFHGMVLRALLGDGPRELAPAGALRPDQVVLAGVRALDPGERTFVAEHRIRQVAVTRLASPSVLVDEVAATGADAVYLHIDLDVLDPEVFGAVGTPEPGGLTLEQLITAVRGLAARFTIAGLCLAEYEPQTDGCPEVLSDLITALASVMDGDGEDGTAQEVERPGCSPRNVWQDLPMNPIRVAEIEPGKYSLCLVAGTTDVDDLIRGRGHEPNGEFWAGIAELLVLTEAGALAGAFEPDPEGGAFYAYSNDRGVIDDLANRLRLVATDGNRLRQLMDFADASGFEFDD